MAYEKEIIITANTKGAQKDMRDLSAIILEQKEITLEFEQELQRLEKQLKDTSKGNLAAQKSIKDQIVNIKDALKDQSLSMKQLTLEKQKAAEQDKGSIINLQKTSKLFTLLNNATGGMSSAFLDLAKASKLSGAAMKTALISSGIGIAVVAVGLLYENFDKVKTVVLKLVPGLKSVGEFFGNIVDAVTDFIGVTSEAERALDSLRKTSDKSLAMNKKFMAEQGYFQDEFTKKKIDAKNRYLEAVKEEGASQVLLARQLNAELADIDKQRIDDQNKRREEAKPKEEEIKPREAVKGIGGGAIGMGSIKDSPELLQQKLIGDQKIATNRAIQDQIRLYNKQISEEDLQDQILKEELLRDAKYAIANQTLGLIAEIAGKGSKIGKAIAITQATISGIEGVQNAYSTAQKSPITALFPAYPYIQAGLAGAFSLMQIKKIASVKEGDTSGSSISGSSGSAPAAPSFNLVQGTGSNQIAQGLGQQQRPIQAYVVSNNVTTAQALDRNIIAGASL